VQSWDRPMLSILAFVLAEGGSKLSITEDSKSLVVFEKFGLSLLTSLVLLNPDFYKLKNYILISTLPESKPTPIESSNEIFSNDRLSILYYIKN
jgi:hypothetical protein